MQTPRSLEVRAAGCRPSDGGALELTTPRVLPSCPEYNPGGGKDQVEKYLQMSKQELIGAAKDMKTILSLLDLPTD